MITRITKKEYDRIGERQRLGFEKESHIFIATNQKPYTCTTRPPELLREVFTFNKNLRDAERHQQKLKMLLE